MPFPWGASTPHAIHIPSTHPTQNPKLHLDQFSRFRMQPTAESLYTLQCALHAINALLKINRRDSAIKKKCLTTVDERLLGGCCLLIAFNARTVWMDARNDIVVVRTW